MSEWWVPGLGRYLLHHPRDIASVVRAAWRLRRRDWWRRRPWLPLPAPEYWHFRLTTVNGPHGRLDPAAVVAAARWSDRQRVGR
jgi:hypothetical protein